MHPMAVLGILATVGGVLAVGVALFQMNRFGIPIGPALADAATFLPYLIFLCGGVMWVSLAAQRGRKAWPYLAGTLALTALTYLIFNR